MTMPRKFTIDRDRLESYRAAASAATGAASRAAEERDRAKGRLHELQVSRQNMVMDGYKGGPQDAAIGALADDDDGDGLGTRIPVALPRGSGDYEMRIVDGQIAQARDRYERARAAAARAYEIAGHRHDLYGRLAAYAEAHR